MKYLSILLAALFFQFTLQAQTKEASIKVWGNCGMCKSLIEKAAKADGVVSADWNMEKHMLAVVYDPAKITSLKVQEQIAAVGYDTEAVYADDAVYAKLHGCCKYERRPKNEGNTPATTKEAPIKGKKQTKTTAVAQTTSIVTSNTASGNVFTGAIIQASGLTCALCSNAINSALEQLSFITSIEPELNTSSFIVKFKENTPVSFDAIRNAVIDAGFSVSNLKVTANFKEPLAIDKDKHLSLHGLNLHFMDVKKGELAGEQVMTVIDKNFLSAKEFKEYSKTTDFACYETGLMADCCQDSGKQNQRIYHVTVKK